MSYLKGLQSKWLVCHQRWQAYSGVCFLVVSLSLTSDRIVLSSLTVSQCLNLSFRPHFPDCDQPNFRACSCLVPSPLPFLGTAVGGWLLLRCLLTQQIQASRETRPACFGDASRNAMNSQRSSLLQERAPEARFYSTGAEGISKSRSWYRLLGIATQVAGLSSTHINTFYFSEEQQ